MAVPLDKLGSAGAAIAAAACPICFPKLALVGGLLGLGAFSAWEYQFLVAAQALVVVAVAGHVLACRRHGRRWVLATALAGGAAVFAGLYVTGSEWLVYAGLAALIIPSFRDLWRWIGRRTASPAR
jgi:mercuric ion transport protein